MGEKAAQQKMGGLKPNPVHNGKVLPPKKGCPETLNFPAEVNDETK